ncbi:MAG: hypothetical protein K2X11_02345 [Acetobacteraceae bacterium]|nr:hypothetical protein [Acetobacteraceae bacterium]
MGPPRAIPVLDARDTPHPAAFACRALPGETAELIRAAERHYSRVAVRLGDGVSRRWLARNSTPYAREVEAVAAAVARPGARLLNTSFEWGCTTGARATPDGAMEMLRVLDWDLDGLGRNLCVIRQAGPAGEWWNIGWPGFVGCITGLAPGRFAAAINQPPLPETALGRLARRGKLRGPAMLADWAAQRPLTWRTEAPPPSHLLRQVMETAPDYGAALALLRDSPIAAPALFILAGTRAAEGAVIERTRDDARLRPAAPAVVAANHWDAMPLRGAPRWRDSAAREARLLADFVVEPPVLNPLTRVVARMEPATGHLALEGHERHGLAARLEAGPLP